MGGVAKRGPQQVFDRGLVSDFQDLYLRPAALVIHTSITSEAPTGGENSICFDNPVGQIAFKTVVKEDEAEYSV